MKWKLLQSITGSGVITLPDNYDELLAIAIADSTDNYSKYSVQIPHDLLSAQQEWHRFKAGSYSSTAYNSEAVVRVKRTLCNWHHFTLMALIVSIHVGCACITANL